MIFKLEKMQKKENIWNIKKQKFKTEKNGSKINGEKKERQKGKNMEKMDLSICICFAFILLCRFAFFMLLFCIYFPFFPLFCPFYFAFVFFWILLICFWFFPFFCFCRAFFQVLKKVRISGGLADIKFNYCLNDDFPVRKLLFFFTGG